MTWKPDVVLYHGSPNGGGWHELLKLYPDAPFATCWSRSGDRLKYSLRSEDSRMDVSEVARGYGGGGHRNASGFEVLA